ncbi:hypothetical protein [Chitinilyticum piscinae]|uniref:Uncharacterized protein n=1 Tax=Chitinilyticum piscinae TaxID=2866724 RepID=A0A8J7FSL4_9NEIS|nr:hypothetical protein [Chitinilyticum piscinae]MBE9609861.1 hypothetical protein [Chitinilyticum piscinae]
MADWSIWNALEEWRSRRHELDAVFAYAGINNNLETQVNRICVDLKRQPPTPPLVTGDPSRDGVELARYYEGYYRHFDDSLEKAESLLRQPWVPEAESLAQVIHAEISRLRAKLRSEPGRNPGFAELEQLLQHYIRLDSPGHPVEQGILQDRRNTLIDTGGFPLLVQHSLASPYSEQIPPLTSDAFKALLAEKANTYLATPWLQTRLITGWYITLALDQAISHKKRDALDDARLRAHLKRRWPSLSLLLPHFDHADQIWYLALVIMSLLAFFSEHWLIGGLLMGWLYLSLLAHRRERIFIETRREHLAERAKAMKKVRDRFVQSQLPNDKLSFLVRQFDEHGEYFDPSIFELIRLYQLES